LEVNASAVILSAAEQKNGRYWNTVSFNVTSNMAHKKWRNRAVENEKGLRMFGLNLHHSSLRLWEEICMPSTKCFVKQMR